MIKKNISAPEPDFTEMFFKEVSEEVQNDNLKAFWKKYGVQIVAFVVVCLTIAVSFETIKHWREVQNQKWSDAFAYATVLHNQGKTDDSLKMLTSLAEDGNAVYADLAQMQTVNILLEQNKTQEALSKLETFIEKGHNAKLKNAARIKLASYKADSAPTAELEALLQPLIDSHSAWMPEAKELIALSYLRQNNTAQALEIYKEIAVINDVNDILRARAQNMISVLTSAEGNK